MDEGWGNIIYLLLLLVFGIFGALKKKKPVPISPPEDEEISEQQISTSPKSEKRLDSVLEAFLGEKMPETYAHTDEIEPVIPMEKEVPLDTVPEPKDLEEMSIEYLDDTKWKKSSVLDGLSDKFSEGVEEESEFDEIDWRNAIIYKEILERKYN